MAGQDDGTSRHGETRISEDWKQGISREERKENEGVNRKVTPAPINTLYNSLGFYRLAAQ